MGAIEELPNKVTEQLKEKLIGVFVIEGLGTSGFSEHIYKDGDYYGGFIVLDQDVLFKLKANEWASWKLNSAFKQDSNYKLSIKLEEDTQNNTKAAIQFILLHEIGHIVGLSKQAHPKTENGDPIEFEFSSLSWKNFEESTYDKDFKNRKDIKFYSFKNASVDIKDSTNIISNLKQSDFVSTYASNNFFEDFAEAYAIYVHTVLMKKPYILKLEYIGKELSSIRYPFSTKRLNKKKNYFDKLFGED